jgi:hypothetical protein
MNTHIEQALNNFRDNGGRYARAERYYDGDHELAFASAKFENTFGALFREFALNLCPAVCDAIRDRLKIERFSVSSPHASKGSMIDAGSPELSAFCSSPHFVRATDTETAERIWHRNRMDARAGEVHKEALKNGDAYVIVWPDSEGSAAIFPNAASSCTVEYDEEDPGKIVWAAKFWRTRDKHTRLNLFYPDRIERYITSKPHEGILPEAKEFIPFVQSASFSLSKRDKSGTLSNPYGVVPVFHFANNASIGEFGRSELEDAIPVQDGMNKSVLDMLVAMEFASFRQRWVAGIEIEYDNDGNLIAPFKSGIENLWVSGNETARFGDFETVDLEQFLKVKDGFRTDIASVTGTPLYYLLPQGRGFTSGEAMRKAETRFIAKVRDRQTSFGQVWADVMQFALRIEGTPDVILKTRWEDAARVSEKETLENLLLKVQLGLSPAQALREAGYRAEPL